MAGRGGFQMSDGDWACPNPGCSNVNFARRSTCNRCQTPRPEGLGGEKPKPTSADVRGPPGLFQPGDWTCNTCGNVNWERRNECNMCKSSKPGMSGLDEKRDGAGGGFNERQERAASAKAEIDDDGYDDFGMRKKVQDLQRTILDKELTELLYLLQKVKASKAEREAAALARLQQSYSAIYQPPQSATDSTGPVSKKLDDSIAVPADTIYRDEGEKQLHSRSPVGHTSKPRNSSSRRSRSRSRDQRHRSPNRERNRRDRSPVRRGRDGDRRRRSRSRGRSNSRGRDRGLRDRRSR